MHPLIRRVPLVLTVAAALALLAHGPIPQWPGYHDFADQRTFAGIVRGADVLSNLGFAVVGAWGLWRLWPQRRLGTLAAAWPGFALFLVALVLTALGSAYYHLAPGNARLVFDRLPIALASAGLLAGVHADTHGGAHRRVLTAALALAGIASVLWWYYTETQGRGDLRPYLFVQLLPLLIVPLWQTIHRAPRADRLAFAAAIALYLLARLAEAADGAVFAALGALSGHTLKHVLASAAAACIVFRLTARAKETARGQDRRTEHSGSGASVPAAR